MDERGSIGDEAAVGPREEYGRRLEAGRSEAKRLAGLDDLAGNLRLATFLAGLAAAFLAWRGSIPPLGILPAPLAFAALVAWHGRVLAARRRAEGVAAHHERSLRRLDGHWAGEGASGARFLDEEHPYAADLDLFGAGSLFERLCAARTAAGEATLASWLLAGAGPEEIRIRHRAVDDLRPRIDFREDLALLGDDVRPGVAPESLSRWGSDPRRSAPTWLRLALGLVASATVSSVAALFAERIGPTIPLVLLGLEALIAYGLAPRTRKALAEVENRAAELATLAGLLARIEREPFDSPRLIEVASALRGQAGPASRRIARLGTLVAWLESSHNVFFALIGAVLLWKTQFGLAIEAWREAEGPSIGPWIDAVGRLEAYASLAGYAFENPTDPYPELVAAGPLIEGEGIGHPLLPPDACVRNDLALGGDLRVLAVSGSNMSGKSTWLRTVGINAVLAQAGAPVRARRLKMSPLTIGGTLRVHDSLQAGRSRFYAEILRLRQLIDLASGSPPLLFLIDEILHGTNSSDRLQGAGAIVKGLIDRGAIGLFTTHDLALAAVAEDLAPRARNVHFADHLDERGRLAFDYRMRPGVVRQSNAIALMRAVGLDI